MAGDRLIIFQTIEHPRTSRTCIGQRFQRGKRLRGDNKESFLRIEVMYSLGEIGTINIRDKAESHITIAVISQGIVSHMWTEIRAANTDINDIADTLARIAFPRAATYPIGESSHLVQYSMDIRYYILAIDENSLIFRRTQGNVENSTLLCHIDLLAFKHSIDTFTQPGRSGKIK